jgi:hypothetical protein
LDALGEPDRPISRSDKRAVFSFGLKKKGGFYVFFTSTMNIKFSSKPMPLKVKKRHA